MATNPSQAISLNCFRQSPDGPGHKSALAVEGTHQRAVCLAVAKSRDPLGRVAQMFEVPLDQRSGRN
jgi:hypothetical protein